MICLCVIGNCRGKYSAVGRSYFTRQVDRFYRGLLERRSCQLSSEQMLQSAMIFAPHPDDDTLGCGGTVIKKIATGSSVTIVIMTDGVRSHRNLVAPSTLREMRKREALASAHILGVEERRVNFLNFENGKLTDQRKIAEQRVRRIIDQSRPEQIFIPYHGDGVSDHLATYDIVISVLRGVIRKPQVYEYPIWYWDYWPWVGLGGGIFSKVRMLFKSGIYSGFGLRFVKEFGSTVFVGDVLDRKRRALEQHQTQMVRMGNDPRWPILSDVADGDFLRCFFHDHEVFHRSSVGEG